MDWQQQPGESDKAYAKFLAFRNAGSQRSIMGANGGKPNGGLYRQAHKWRWGERASAWDASLRERTDEELVDRMVPARHKLADKADALIERLWDAWDWRSYAGTQPAHNRLCNGARHPQR